MDYSTIKDKVIVNGRKLTVGLFDETSRGDVEAVAIFSLKTWGEIYVDIGDPTGYKQCQHLLGDWEHWNVLKNNPTLKVYFDKWDEELAVKIRSEAIERMIEASKDIKGQASARWLAENGFQSKKVGRPVKQHDTKYEQKEEAERLAKDSQHLKLVGGNRA